MYKFILKINKMQTHTLSLHCLSSLVRDIRSNLKSSADMLRQLLLAAVVAVARGAQLEVTHMAMNDAANGMYAPRLRAHSFKLINFALDVRELSTACPV